MIFLFVVFWCLFNIAIVRNWIVKILKIHSHTNLNIASNHIHQSSKQNDDYLLNSDSIKKKKHFHSGTGSALLNTGGQDKLTGAMFSGRTGPQVLNKWIFAEQFCLLQLFRDLHRLILVLLNIAIELKKNLAYYNNSVKGKFKQICFYYYSLIDIFFLLVWNLIVKN